MKVNEHTTNILQIQIPNENYFLRYCLGKTSLAIAAPEPNQSNDKADQLHSTREKCLTPTNDNTTKFNELIRRIDTSFEKWTSSVDQKLNSRKCFGQRNEH